MLGTIDLSNQVVFGFETAGFCWKKTRGKVELVGLSNRQNACAKGTVSHPSKLDKEIDYFKL